MQNECKVNVKWTQSWHIGIREVSGNSTTAPLGKNRVKQKNNIRVQNELFTDISWNFNLFGLPGTKGPSIHPSTVLKQIPKKENPINDWMPTSGCEDSGLVVHRRTKDLRGASADRFVVLVRPQKRRSSSSQKAGYRLSTCIWTLLVYWCLLTHIGVLPC